MTVQATRTPHKPAGGPKGRARATRASHHAALRALLASAAGPWVRLAACGPGSDLTPELFWPSGERDPRASVAKLVCAGCGVRAECLAFAEATRQPADPKAAGGGVWGGLSGAERLTQRRKGWRPGMAAPALRALTEGELAAMLRSPWARWLPPEVLGVVARRWQHRAAAS